MIRPLALTLAAVALLLAVPAAPAAAQNDLARQLIDSCMGCRLPKDLHGRDLHGLRFTGTDLRDVDFSHANLSGAKFTGADLDGTRFDDADLRNVQFVGVRLRRTSFARANTAGVRFVGASVDAGRRRRRRGTPHPARLHGLLAQRARPARRRPARRPGRSARA